MNTYEMKTVVVTPKAELLTAIDEATAQVMPTDILIHVLGKQMEDLVETKVEKVQTFKLQPRQPLKELKNYARYHAGGCGVCMVNTGTCVCATPAAIFHLIVRIAPLAVCCPCIYADFFAEICCICCYERSNACGFNDRADKICACWNVSIGDGLPCARTDYRLNRSCCWDCMSLANDCCCCSSALTGDKPRYGGSTPRNGPEAMFME